MSQGVVKIKPFMTVRGPVTRVMRAMYPGRFSNTSECEMHLPASLLMILLWSTLHLLAIDCTHLFLSEIQNTDSDQ